MGSEQENVRKNKEALKKADEAEKKAQAEVKPEKTEPETEKKGKEEKPGFFKRTWGKIKTGASRAKRKGLKAVSKDPDDMTDDEFNEHLKDLEGEGDIGYASRYYELIDELSKMPSLMALTKQSEGQKDKEEAVDEAVKDTQKEQDSEEAPAADKEEIAKKAQEEPAKAEEPAKKENAPGKIETAEKAETEEAPARTDKEAEEIETAETPAGTEAATESAETEEAPAKEEATEKAEAENTPADIEKEHHSEETPSDKGSVARQIVGETAKVAVENKDKAVGIYKNSRRQKTLEKLAGQTDNTSGKGRSYRYMAAQTNKEKTQAGFDIATTAVNTVSDMLQRFGSSKVGDIAGKIAGYINKALAFGKDFMSKRIEKKAIKDGIKGLVGGNDAYKKLKDKYRLHGQDMRRAIRTAAKHSSVTDLINADKDKLSDEYAKNVKDKDSGVADVMGLAGGTDELAMKKALGRS